MRSQRKQWAQHGSRWKSQNILKSHAPESMCNGDSYVYVAQGNKR